MSERFVFVTFTCRRDEILLPVWAEGIRRACARDGVEPVMVAAVDAGDADMVLPQGVARVITRFERRGNLNGAAAVQGILGTLAAAGEAFGAPAVKMDTDTVLTGTGWLACLREAEGPGYVGLEAESTLSATGIAYGFRPGYARACLEVATPWRWGTQDGMPEDRLVCSLALMWGRGRLLPWGGGEWCAAFVPWYFTEAGALRGVQAAVHCGQAAPLAAYGAGVERAVLVRRMMRRVLRELWGTPGRFSV